MGPVRDIQDRTLSDEEEYQELLLGDLRRRPPPVPAKPRGGKTSGVGARGKSRSRADKEESLTERLVEDEGYVALTVGRRTDGSVKGWKAAAVSLAVLVLCLVLLVVLALLGVLKHCVAGPGAREDLAAGGGLLQGAGGAETPILVEVTCHSSERNTSHPFYFDGKRYIYVWTDHTFSRSSSRASVKGRSDVAAKTFLGDTFISPRSELYFIGMEAWLRAAYPLNYTFHASPLAFGLGHTLNNRRPCELYRHALLPLLAKDRLKINMSIGSGNEETDCFASWEMFGMSATMTSLVAFSVSRAAPWIVPDVVTFPDVHVNIGGGYKVSENHFTVPHSGVYFFAISTGLYERFVGHVRLLVNGDVITDLIRTTVTHDGHDMMSAAVMLYMVEGDVVQMNLKSGLLYSDPIFRQISFMGFIYSPKSHKKAWSLELNPTAMISLSRLPYDVIHVDEGNMYDISSHDLNITTSGYYYVHVTVRRPSRYTSVAIVWRPHEGEETKWPLNAVSAGGGGVYTSSTGTVWDLSEGDRVYVQVGGGRTRGDIQSHFIGFRITGLE